MAIAFDATAGQALTGTNSTNTFSLTVGGGSDRYLVVGNQLVNPSAVDVSSVTYNGATCTQLATYSPQDIQANIPLSLYYLANPSSGTNDVVVTSTVATTSSFRSAAASYSGVNNASPEDSDGTRTGATSVSRTVTTTTDNSWVVGVGGTSNAYSSWSGSAVLRGSVLGSQTALADTNGAVTPAGNVTFTYNIGGSDNLGLIVMTMAPAGSSTTIKTWDGVVRANLKTLDGVASANIKTINGIT